MLAKSFSLLVGIVVVVVDVVVVIVIVVDVIVDGVVEIVAIIGVKIELDVDDGAITVWCKLLNGK